MSESGQTVARLLFIRSLCAKMRIMCKLRRDMWSKVRSSYTLPFGLDTFGLFALQPMDCRTSNVFENDQPTRQITFADYIVCRWTYFTVRTSIQMHFTSHIFASRRMGDLRNSQQLCDLMACPRAAAQL